MNGPLAAEQETTYVIINAEQANQPPRATWNPKLIMLTETEEGQKTVSAPGWIRARLREGTDDSRFNLSMESESWQ